MNSGNKQAMREAAIWVATAALGLATIYFYHDLSSLLRVMPGGGQALLERPSARPHVLASQGGGFERHVRLDADGRGHFLVDASVNDRPLQMIADTGATLVMLTYEDAERLGLSPRSLDYSARASTANGTAKVAPITLARLRVANIMLRDVPAGVAEKGALGVNLLGMSFLGKLKRFQMQGDKLVLVQ